jgi:hypothetical protein
MISFTYHFIYTKSISICFFFAYLDGHKGLGNPLQSNDFNASGTMPLKKSESKKNIDRYINEFYE